MIKKKLFDRLLEDILKNLKQFSVFKSEFWKSHSFNPLSRPFYVGVAYYFDCDAV